MSAPGKSRRGRRWRGWLWKLPLAFVAFSVLQVLALRFIDPPFSMFMAARQLDAAIAGDFGFRIAHDWRGMDRISPNLPLALVASEDQNFASHHGFDFAAIEKAQAHNEKMIERAEKRGKPVRRLRGASTISQQTAKNLWPKRRILEVYANIAEFGDGIYGAQAAARSFFRKDAAKLSAAEAARLAAVLPSPKRYNAARPGPYVQRRTNSIQRQMRYMGGSGWLRTLD